MANQLPTQLPAPHADLPTPPPTGGSGSGGTTGSVITTPAPAPSPISVASVIARGPDPTKSNGDWKDAMSGGDLDPEWIARLINRTLGENVQQSGHIRVVDYNLNPLDMGMTTTEPGDLLQTSDLISYVAVGSESLQWDSSQVVQRKLDFTMLDPKYDPNRPVELAYNPRHHFLQISTTLACQGKTVEFPLGTYWMDTPQAKPYKDKRIYTFSGLDVTALMTLSEFLSDYTADTATYGTGTKGALQAALDLITMDAVPIGLGGTGKTPQGNPHSGCGIPARYVDIDWSGNQPLTIAQIFAAGGNCFGEGINVLLDSINYWPAHMRNRTKVAFRPQPDFVTSKPVCFWDYTTDGYSPDIGFDQDWQSSSTMANIFRVEGGQAAADGGTALSSLQANTDPTSGLSIQNLRTLGGGPLGIARYERNTDLIEQSMVDQWCRMRLNGGDVITDKLTFESLINPLIEAYDYLITWVTDKNDDTQIFSNPDHPYLCVGYTMPFLSPGAAVSHTLIRSEAE